MPDDFRFKTLADELLPPKKDERTCRNCACVYHVEKPRIMPSTMTKEEWDKAPEMWVCRLDPPFIAATEKGPTLVQKPTAPNLVCWHWVTLGTLPGDQRVLANLPPLIKCGAVSPIGRGLHCELSSGHSGPHLDEEKNAWLS